MALECYFMSGSPFAWRALLALQLKGLEFKATEVHGSKGDNKTPEYLAMNPHGQVPVLKDGDTTVYESLAILAYLDRQYPEKPLFGATPEESALIWQRTMELNSHLFSNMSNLVRAVFRGAVEGNEEALNEDIATIKEELSEVTGWFNGEDYLAGDSMSAVDISLYPMLALLLRLMGNVSNEKLIIDFIPIAEHFPAIAAWMTRVEAMPGFDAVYPPHWKAQKAAE